MADLSTAVEYDRPHPVVILHPVTGEDQGIRVNVVSNESARVVEAQRKAVSAYWAALASAGKDEPKPEAPDSARIALVHCIDSWDWAGESFAHISGSGSPSLEDREFVIDHPNAIWFRNQLAAGCANIANFTNPSPKSVPTGSKET